MDILAATTSILPAHNRPSAGAKNQVSDFQSLLTPSSVAPALDLEGRRISTMAGTLQSTDQLQLSAVGSGEGDNSLVKFKDLFASRDLDGIDGKCNKCSEAPDAPPDEDSKNTSDTRDQAAVLAFQQTIIAPSNQIYLALPITPSEATESLSPSKAAVPAVSAIATSSSPGNNSVHSRQTGIEAATQDSISPILSPAIAQTTTILPPTAQVDDNDDAGVSPVDPAYSTVGQVTKSISEVSFISSPESAAAAPSPTAAAAVIDMESFSSAPSRVLAKPGSSPPGLSPQESPAAVSPGSMTDSPSGDSPGMVRTIETRAIGVSETATLFGRTVGGLHIPSLESANAVTLPGMTSSANRIAVPAMPIASKTSLETEQSVKELDTASSNSMIAPGTSGTTVDTTDPGETPIALGSTSFNSSEEPTRSVDQLQPSLGEGAVSIDERRHSIVPEKPHHHDKTGSEVDGNGSSTDVANDAGLGTDFQLKEQLSVQPNRVSPNSVNPARHVATQDLYSSAVSQTNSHVSQAPVADAAKEPAGTGILHTNPVHTVDQVVKATQLTVQRGMTDLTVRLDPPDLGVLHVKVTLAAGEMQAQVRAESAATHQLIFNHRDDLHIALQQSGLRLDQLYIPDFNASFSQFNQQRGTFQWQQQSHTLATDRIAGRDADSIPGDIFGLDRPSDALMDSFA